ncbi:hypothetical protein MXD60_13555 [Frankia sp. AgB32]|nr:hypothetical protein [Frankia sp. AgB32]
MPRGRPSEVLLPHALTSTIDLSALQARLRAEHTAVIARVREPVSRRGGAGRADPESTQVVSRGLVAGGVRESAGRGRHRGATGPRARIGDDDLAAVRYGADPELDDVDADGDADGGPAQDGGTRSKALWTMADQAVSSATNAAISFLIAHQVTDVEYGAFGVSYTLFALVIGLSRGATCMPLSMFYSGRSKSQFRAAASATTGSSLVFGIAVGAVFVLAGLGIGGSVGSALLAMGAVLPGLLLQDAWRFVFFAMGRPVGALINDLVWAAVQVLGIWLLVHRGVTQSSPLVLAWGASAMVAAFVGVVQAGFWPAPGATRRWLAENRTDAGYLAAEFLTVQGALQTSMLAIGAVGSLSTIGALQGARTLLGPTTVVGVGVVSFALPEFSKRTSMDRRARERAAWALSGVVVGVGAAWSLIFYLLPERYGHALLGDSWDGVKAILGLSILHYLAAGAPVGPACMIYALGKTKTTFRINAAFAPVLLAFPVIGAVVGEARGAVIGFNIAFWALVPVWFVLLRRLAQQHDEEQAALRQPAPVASRPAGRRPRRADNPAPREVAWPDDPAGTGGWPVGADGSQRGARSSPKRWDAISSTKVRKADVPEELRRDAPRTQHLRMERGANMSRLRVGDSERGIAGMDDGSGRARARPDRRGADEQWGRATGPRHGRRDS